MRVNTQRNDEAVSAAVATVLLFGGVVSIIGLMLVSMVPIIEELEGSIERSDMSSQMMILAQQTETLSESGMPGDSTNVELIPIDGNVEWDLTRGGMWYSSTWQDESTFRIKQVLDFDNTIEVKHPETFTSSVCFDDLRLGPSRPFIYSAPIWADTAQIAISTGLAIPLGPVEVKLYQQEQLSQTLDLQIFDTEVIDLSSGISKFESTHELVIFYSMGVGGATLVSPSDSNPKDNTGRNWIIPLNEGNNRIHIMSEHSNEINIETSSESTDYFAVYQDEFRAGVTFTKEILMDEPDVVRVSTSTDSHIILQTDTDNNSGSASLISSNGNYLGNEFISPSLDGEITFTNPGTRSVTVTWRGGGTSIPAIGSVSVSWPPASVDGAPILDADGDIFVTWKVTDGVNSPGGIHLVAASDTGATSGKNHNLLIDNDGNSNSISITKAGVSSKWNITGDASIDGEVSNQIQNQIQAINSGTYNFNVDEGHPVKIHLIKGENGIIQSKHDGVERCSAVNMMASGWITVDLPWASLAGQEDLIIKQAWESGSFPSSLKITLIGHNGASTHSNLATSWVFHLSRLTYTFTSSITGMEVAYSGGAVVTNHPEFSPSILREPVDRAGPGPRFAATIPSMHPATDGISGGGKLSLDIELSSRQTLASEVAYEVRRGWAEPYGVAIANEASDGLDLSEDWTIYPGRLDLLNDYVGWVPDPSIGTSEAVWHTNGEPIQFSLQLSSLDVLMQEVIG